MTTVPGKWAPRRGETTVEGDSTLISRKYDHAPFENLLELTMGVVIEAEPEPGYVRVSAVCEPDAGFRRNQCAWPGPNVAVGKSGKTDGSRAGIHGFYDAPMPGQSVLMGFVNGRMGSPIVIQKYSSRIDQQPHLEALHDLPLTNSGHDYRDVLVGSFTGSYIALRGGVPIPGQIEISSEADTTITAGAGAVITAGARVVIEGKADVEIGSDTGLVLLGPEPRQPVLLGDDAIDLLDRLLTAIQAITVTSPPLTGGTFPIDNPGDFSSLAGELNDLLSQKVKTG